MNKTHWIGGVLAAGIAAAALACGGSNSSNPGGPSGGGGGGGGGGTTTCTTPPTSTTITISGNAVCPQNVTVALGTQVTFVNSDTTAHEMESDPHPEHTDCIEINQVGRLEVGQRRNTGNLNTARRCGFHDHLRNEVQSLRGSITIQ